MIENVRGFLGAVFSDYRQKLKRQLSRLGYETDWHLFNASDFGVPQLGPRVVIIALRRTRPINSHGQLAAASIHHRLGKRFLISWLNAVGEGQEFAGSGG